MFFRLWSSLAAFLRNFCEIPDSFVRFDAAFSPFDVALSGFVRFSVIVRASCKVSRGFATFHALSHRFCATVHGCNLHDFAWFHMVPRGFFTVVDRREFARVRSVSKIARFYSERRRVWSRNGFRRNRVEFLHSNSFVRGSIAFFFLETRAIVGVLMKKKQILTRPTKLRSRVNLSAWHFFGWLSGPSR